MSPIVFLIFISMFSIAYIFSMNTIQLRENVAQDILANRIYYKFLTISDSVVEIIEKELGGISSVAGLNVTVDEQPDFSYVTIVERLPHGVEEFNEDLANYENFVEKYLNETNVKIDTGIGGLGGSMRIEIEPYNIVYDHPLGFGQKEVEITPEETSTLNAYDMTFKLIDANITSTPSFGGPGCSGGSLRWNVTVIGDSSVYGPVIKYIKPDKMCKLQVDATCNQPAFKVTNKQNTQVNDGDLFVEVLPGCTIISTISLNLTDVPGKTEVNLPDGQINVIETLYNIQKNDTVYLGE